MRLIYLLGLAAAVAPVCSKPALPNTVSLGDDLQLNARGTDQSVFYRQALRSRQMKADKLRLRSKALAAKRRGLLGSRVVEECPA